MFDNKKLTKLRTKARLSQESLAHAAGLTTQAVARLERGHSSPHFLTVCVLADALGTTLNNLRKKSL